ncbi:Gmad2 immunoglobulin-like domain-containing protein [Pengzhenrongella sicca]|uniref:Gmad2 immunoglobulin-like domain-containing protein n=1 Tax=Pengzhenrongella sicca TaxID=2819238 RepID=A0A8A4ZFN3_9MICO|nr:Gmad2 immunoglobulin-like domain-containing protein [Pengzhenrongella sicca]QTE28478.1 Gmad2 immunoglobulin-like domain-containing protein [Pengzhenrongella sicca]
MNRSTRSRPAFAFAAAAVAAAALVLTGCAGTAEPGDSSSSSESASPTLDATTPPAEPTTPATDPAAEPTGTTVIEAPVDGSTVAGPQVAVSGQGTAFEATLSWRILTAGTEDVVQESYTNAGANGEIGPFAFTVELAPGTYTLEVWEPDMSDGAAGTPTARATTTFTVS